MSGSDAPFRRSCEFAPLTARSVKPKKRSAMTGRRSRHHGRGARTASGVGSPAPSATSQTASRPARPRRSSSRRSAPGRHTPARSTSCVEIAARQASSLVSASSRLATLTVSPIAVSEAARPCPISPRITGAEMHADAHAQRLVELDREVAIERVQGQGHAALAASPPPPRRPRRAEQRHDPVADELVDGRRASMTAHRLEVAVEDEHRVVGQPASDRLVKPRRSQNRTTISRSTPSDCCVMVRWRPQAQPSPACQRRDAAEARRGRRSRTSRRRCSEAGQPGRHSTASSQGWHRQQEIVQHARTDANCGRIGRRRTRAEVVQLS